MHTKDVKRYILGFFNIYGTDNSNSSKKFCGLGISCINPQTSIISSTEVAGTRSSWKMVRTLEVDLRRDSSLCRIHSAKATDHSFVSVKRIIGAEF